MNANDENRFWSQWPTCLASLEEVYCRLMPLPDGRSQQVLPWLQRLHGRPALNEIERELRKLWMFDGRFLGEVRDFGKNEYAWAVYSLCYLAKDWNLAVHLLQIYVPLLGIFIRRAFGEVFRTKVGATFMDDVGHLLWDVEGLLKPDDHELFDWHGNRNTFSPAEVKMLLDMAQLPPLRNLDFPPRRLLLRYTTLQDPFPSERHFQRALLRFYTEKGYPIS